MQKHYRIRSYEQTRSCTYTLCLRYVHYIYMLNSSVKKIEEYEKDIKLAAQIGEQLLAENISLRKELEEAKSGLEQYRLKAESVDVRCPFQFMSALSIVSLVIINIKYSFCPPAGKHYF